MTYNKRQIGTEKEKSAGAYLEKNGITGVRKTNQLANFAMVPWSKNLKISNKPPTHKLYAKIRRRLNF